VSIVRIGLGETKNFREGYEAIFGKKSQRKSKSQVKASPPKRKKKAKKK
jgi:hypothetical protein